MKEFILSKINKFRSVLFYIGLLTAAVIYFHITVEKAYCYFLPLTVLVVISLSMMCLLKILLKADTKIIIITSFLMTVGIFAQALTFSVTAPVRQTINVIYETAYSEELIAKYPQDKSDIENSVSMCKKYLITPDTAKKALKSAAEMTHINIPDCMFHLENKKDILLGLKENNDEEDIYEEMYTEILKDDPKNKNLSDEHIRMFRSDNGDIADPISISAAEKLDVFLSDCEAIPAYKVLLNAMEDVQRTDHARKLTKDILFGFGLAVAGMVVFDVLCLNFDMMIIAVFLLQMGLMGFMAWKGEGDGAEISSNNLNLLEVTKILYILIMANLLGKKNKKNIILFPLISRLLRIKENKCVLNRIWCALVYNILTAVLFVLCSEMGTMTVLLFTGLLITVICVSPRELKEAFFPKKKLWVNVLSIVCISVFALIIIGIKQVYILYTNPDRFVSFDETEETQTKYCVFDKTSNFSEYNFVLRRVMKIDQRIYAFKNADPDKNLYVNRGSGSQYIQLINARRSAGWFGCPIDSDQRTEISVSESDMVFGQFVHSLGVIMGLILIALYASLIAVSYRSLKKVDDTYYRTLGFICVCLLAVQNLLHIAINLSLFPISGIPLMYVSRGGAIQTVSLIITMFIVEISANNMQVSRKNEELLDGWALGNTKPKKMFFHYLFVYPDMEDIFKFVTAVLMIAFALFI